MKAWLEGEECSFLFCSKCLCQGPQQHQPNHTCRIQNALLAVWGLYPSAFRPAFTISQKPIALAITNIRALLQMNARKTSAEIAVLGEYKKLRKLHSAISLKHPRIFTLTAPPPVVGIARFLSFVFIISYFCCKPS